MNKAFWLLGIALALLVSLYLAPAVPQWQSYHDFADQRTFLNIENFLNTSSNFAFCFVALLGMHALWQKRGAFSGFTELAPFIVFFVGLFFVGIASFYYHLEPNNARLVLDRAAMSVGFMAMLAIAISTKISRLVGFYLVWPFLVFGVFSVYYSYIQDDLRLYAAMQYASILFTIAIICLYKTAYPPTRYFVWAFVCYAIAKVFELTDAQVFTATNHLISGHTLKHLISSGAAYFFVLMVTHKRDF